MDNNNAESYEDGPSNSSKKGAANQIRLNDQKTAIWQVRAIPISFDEKLSIRCTLYKLGSFLTFQLQQW